MTFTRNHVVCPNIPGTSLWRYVWTLTRALKKAGWKYKASSDGTNKDITGDPQKDYWGVGQRIASGSSAFVGSTARGRATVTGLAGITSADKGRFLCISGSAYADNNHFHQIEEIVSPTSAKIDARNFTVTNEAADPRAWAIHDPTYDLTSEWTTGSALSTIQSWWAASGPSVVRIPITEAPYTGSYGNAFIRGENIRQATTGFQGEIMGYVWYAPTVFGYLAVNPRVRGTGEGVYGLASSSAGIDISGDVSGAIVSGSAISKPIEYNEQIVLWKFHDLSGSGQGAQYGRQFSGYFDTVADITSSFCGSAQLVSSCTAKIAPGAGYLPPHGAVIRGGGASDAYTNWQYHVWGSNSNSVVIANRGYGLAVANDCIEEEGWSQDGSWTWVYSTAMTDGCEGASFQRLNDTEPGELCPFLYISNSTSDMYTRARTGLEYPIDDGSGATYFGDCHGGVGWCGNDGSNAYTLFRGWMAYGTTNEMWADWEAGYLNAVGAGRSTYAMIFGNGNAATTYNSPETFRTVPPYGQVKVRDQIWATYNYYTRGRKGTLKWIWAVQGGQRFDTYDDKKVLQLGNGWSALSTGITRPALVIGPWDGTTTQLV